jgi:hypothetical protein
VRRQYLALIAAAILIFLLISGVLARVFSADGAERSAVTGLIEAEARGDQNGMLGRIQGCRASAQCRARVAADATALRRAGTVSILQLQSSSGFSLGSTLGLARVAWSAGGSLPIVQCIQVRRAGNAVSGLRIELLAISARLKSDADCPVRLQ